MNRLDPIPRLLHLLSVLPDIMQKRICDILIAQEKMTKTKYQSSDFKNIIKNQIHHNYYHIFVSVNNIFGVENIKNHIVVNK